MKSIKEKAEEYLLQNKDEILCVYDRYAGFVDGANYVISCIEKEMLSCKEFSQSQMRMIMQFCEQLEATSK